MTLEFPNESRIFEDAKRRIRFWGYDQAIEITFFVGIDALLKLKPEITDTSAGYLDVFDEFREQIRCVAEQCYSRGKQKAYAYRLLAQEF
jgi:hypothetical protein